MPFCLDQVSIVQVCCLKVASTSNCLTNSFCNLQEAGFSSLFRDRSVLLGGLYGLHFSIPHKWLQETEWPYIPKLWVFLSDFTSGLRFPELTAMSAIFSDLKSYSDRTEKGLIVQCRDILTPELVILTFQSFSSCVEIKISRTWSRKENTTSVRAALFLHKVLCSTTEHMSDLLSLGPCLSTFRWVRALVPTVNSPSLSGGHSDQCDSTALLHWLDFLSYLHSLYP